MLAAGRAGDIAGRCIYRIQRGDAAAGKESGDEDAAAGSSNLAGVAGGALGGLLLGFAAAVVTVRRNQ